MRPFVFLVLWYCTAAFAGFSAGYRQPQNATDYDIANQLRQAHTLEKLVAALNRYVVVPGDIPVIAQSCGAVNAYYSPNRREVVICYELLSQHAAMLNKKYKQAAPGTSANILSAEITYVLLHEVGHAVFDVHRIPVLGKEEDAADEFAAFLLLSTGGASIIQRAPLFMPLMKTSWITKTLHGSAVYGDEHALSEQRMANLICYGYGKDPQNFASAAAAVRLPQHRADRCATEYAKMDRDIRNLLGDKLTLNGRAGTAVAQQQLQQRTALLPLARPDIVVPTAENMMIQMLDHYSCGNCHRIDTQSVGPAFRDVAARYRGKDVTQQLVHNIRVGSAGLWGPVPAPPQNDVPETDATEMVRWLLSL